MRSYHQWCALAKALDVVGDRWVLLIVRELLIRGPCRYTDIRGGLPGIATNLLAERLRELQEVGIVVCEQAPPPIATALYSLTPRGRALEGVILALGRWGATLLGGRKGDDIFLPHWLVPPLRLHLVDSRPKEPRMEIEVRVGGVAIAITADGGNLDVRLGHAGRAAAIVSGKPEAILALFAGRTPLASSAGVKIEGDVLALSRIIPRPARDTAPLP